MRTTVRAGFALVAVLWALLIVSALGGAYLVEAREMALVSENRTVELRASQAALSGVERAHNLLARLHALEREELLGAASRARVSYTWNHLDSAFAEFANECLGESCFRLRVRDLGTALNVNRASADQLRRFFMALDAGYREADVASQSMADWIDPDDLHRPRGAERSYYETLPFPNYPPNRPIAQLAELQRVRGVDGALLGRAARHLTVEGEGRINLNAAPLPVLAAVPGLGQEALRVIEEARRRGVVFENGSELSRRLSPTARAELRRAFSRFQRVAAYAPTWLEVTSTGFSRGHPLQVSVRVVFLRAGDRVAEVKRLRVGF